MEIQGYIKKYWSINKQAYLDWDTYKRFCVPKYMIKEYKEKIQKRIESLMREKIFHKQKEIWYS